MEQKVILSVGNKALNVTKEYNITAADIVKRPTIELDMRAKRESTD